MIISNEKEWNNNCKNCERKYLKDLFEDGKELVYICEIDNHYIGYPDEINIECEIEKGDKV